MDHGSTALACRDCGVAIHRKRAAGRAPTRCADCRKTANRASGRRSCQRFRSGADLEMRYTCVDCDGVFDRPNRRGCPPLRCPVCRKRRAYLASATGNEKSKARRADQSRNRSTVCQRCQKTFTCARMGPIPKHCRPCHLKIRSSREYTPKPLPSPITCPGCNKSVPRIRWGGTRKRCTPCARRYAADQWALRNPERKREVMRKSTQRRRAQKRMTACENFSDGEIFDRDRWVCGVCREKINRRLRHPHPRSASLDHIVPLSQGGPHTRANVRAAHLQCNVRRGNRGGGEQLMLIG